MKVIKAQQAFPENLTKSIFLAGPSFRDPKKLDRSWRKDAVEYLRSVKFDGVVFDPEYPKEGTFFYEDQISWEHKAMNMADVIVFWVPRDDKDHIGLTTNVEWGEWFDSGKVVLGTPPEAMNNRYLQEKADLVQAPRFKDLKETLDEALRMIDEGSEREGIECTIPLNVWSNPTFQAWYQNQKKVGNSLRHFRLLWNFNMPSQIKKPLTTPQRMFCWVAEVHVYVASEDRVKTNEFVLGRSDISAVAMFVFDSKVGDRNKVLLVKEFRSPARTPDAFIWELPGGSASEGNPKEIAIEELEEETSLKIDPSRLSKVSTSAQLCGTLSAHQCTLFSGILNATEAERIEQMRGKSFGIVEDSERTYAELVSIQDIIEGVVPVDWSTRGMILNAFVKLVQS